MFHPNLSMKSRIPSSLSFHDDWKKKPRHLFTRETCIVSLKVSYLNNSTDFRSYLLYFKPESGAYRGFGQAMAKAAKFVSKVVNRATRASCQAGTPKVYLHLSFAWVEVYLFILSCYHKAIKMVYFGIYMTYPQVSAFIVFFSQVIGLS